MALMTSAMNLFAQQAPKGQWRTLTLTDGSKVSINYEGFDDATSINGIAIEGMEEGQLYDLSGRRVNPATTHLNGIYIINGKKVLFK